LGWRGLGEKLGVKADCITAGKYLGGGMSFGLFGGLEGSELGMQLMRLFEPGPKGVMHPGTFNNNVLSMAAGIAAAEILTEERLEELNELGDKLRDGIQTRLEEAGVKRMGIRGVGSVMNFWFKDDMARDLWWFFAVERGIYFAPRGFMALSLEIRTEDVEKLLSVFEEFLVRHGELVK
jgi:glutamate-1-semialdehyde 2,1-aminomutase